MATDPFQAGRALAIYLRNHEAAAQAGLDLGRRAAAAQRRRPYAAVLDALVVEIRADRDTLREILRVLRVRPNPALAIALRAGERLGRLKPNGSLVRRAALSDLFEIEALGDAVRAKAAGWRALLAAEVEQRAELPDLRQLLRRAEDQAGRLDDLHRVVAQRVLGVPGDVGYP